MTWELPSVQAGFRKGRRTRDQIAKICWIIEKALELPPKFSKLGFNSTWTKNFQVFKLDLEKAEEPEIKLPKSTGSEKMREFQKNIYFCFINFAKTFDCVDQNKLENS